MTPDMRFDRRVVITIGDHARNVARAAGATLCKRARAGYWIATPHGSSPTGISAIFL